jgi:hypothetical protein
LRSPGTPEPPSPMRHVRPLSSATSC